MKIGEQTKKYRLERNLSQEALAEKIFVTRQTVSNWENDKNYPDIHSLVLLSTLFDISLDTLVKGDLEEMKEQINTESIKEMKQLSAIFSILLLVTAISVVPLMLYFKLIGILIWVFLAGTMMVFAIHLERKKKTYNIQTYKEVVAFFDGVKLDEIAKQREKRKRPRQAIAAALLSGLLTFLICIALYRMLRS